jgi:nitrite reductase (NO-forming)
VGGEIDGVLNPDLVVPQGAEVSITLVNADGMLHDLVLEEFDARTSQFMEAGASETITFVADLSGAFDYICSVPGHVEAGMMGSFVVEDGSTLAIP